MKKLMIILFLSWIIVAFSGCNLGKTKVRDRNQLDSIIQNSSDTANLNHLDVSNITNMDSLFYGSKFNGDISKWDVSKVTSMKNMFAESPLESNYPTSFYGKHKVKSKKELKNIINSHSDTANLNYLDVSKITSMDSLFYGSKFNGNISKWDVSSVTDMSFMFAYSDFNGDISKWDVSKVTNMSEMFSYYSKFNGDISNWNVSSVTDMSYMFYYYSEFNGDISKWDVSAVTDMSYMFQCSKFNGDISNWDVSSVTDMDGMFLDSPLDGNKPDWYRKKIIFSDPEVDGELIEMIQIGAIWGTLKDALRNVPENGNADDMFGYAIINEGMGVFIMHTEKNSSGVSACFDTAVKYYKKASDSGKMHAKLNLGRMYLRLNQPKKAKPLLKFVKDNGDEKSSKKARQYWNRYELWKY